MSFKFTQHMELWSKNVIGNSKLIGKSEQRQPRQGVEGLLEVCYDSNGYAIIVHVLLGHSLRCPPHIHT